MKSSRSYPKISDAELELMKVLWNSAEALNTKQVQELMTDKNRKYTTVSTMLSRLVDKGAVIYEKRGKFYYYSPLINETDYKRKQTKSFMKRLYNGSIKNFVAALVEDNEMSENDISELKKMFDLK